MKKIGIIATLLLISSALTHTCPTCIGELTADTPPFFTDAYDQYWQQRMDADAALMEQQPATDTSSTDQK